MVSKSINWPSSRCICCTGKIHIFEQYGWRPCGSLVSVYSGFLPFVNDLNWISYSLKRRTSYLVCVCGRSWCRQVLDVGGRIEKSHWSDLRSSWTEFELEKVVRTMKNDERGPHHHRFIATAHQCRRDQEARPESDKRDKVFQLAEPVSKDVLWHLPVTGILTVESCAR